jgi:hypothetical protein
VSLVVKQQRRRFAMNSRSKTVGFFSTASILVILASGCVKKDIPRERHLVDCNTNSLRFDLGVEEQPPYQLLLALPKTAPFDSRGRAVAASMRCRQVHGEIVFTEASGKHSRIPINSVDAKWCNWLRRDFGVEAFILCSPALKRGKDYEVHVNFSEAPPPGCSLWFSGMVGRAMPL